jgi:hypothetical protein
LALTARAGHFAELDTAVGERILLFCRLPAADRSEAAGHPGVNISIFLALGTHRLGSLDIAVVLTNAERRVKGKIRKPVIGCNFPDQGLDQGRAGYFFPNKGMKDSSTGIA